MRTSWRPDGDREVVLYVIPPGGVFQTGAYIIIKGKYAKRENGHIQRETHQMPPRSFYYMNWQMIINVRILWKLKIEHAANFCLPSLSTLFMPKFIHDSPLFGIIAEMVIDSGELRKRLPLQCRDSFVVIFIMLSPCAMLRNWEVS